MPGARGESVFTVGGKEYTILFTNRALAQAEGQLGMTMGRLLSRVQESDIGLNEVARLLQIGLEAARRDARLAGPAYTMNTVWEILDEAGFTTMAGEVMSAVAAVLTHSESESEAADPNG
jgi:hypothetical protein